VEDDLMKRTPHPDAKPMGALASAVVPNRWVSSRCYRKGIKMRALIKLFCFIVGEMLAATAAWAGEISTSSNILGPEVRVR